MLVDTYYLQSFVASSQWPEDAYCSSMAGYGEIPVILTIQHRDGMNLGVFLAHEASFWEKVLLLS
jgi:hypothetical protein